jgi:hypothetical protein
VSYKLCRTEMSTPSSSHAQRYFVIQAGSNRKFTMFILSHGKDAILVLKSKILKSTFYQM